VSIDRKRLLDTARVVALSVAMLVVLRLVRGASIGGPELAVFALGTGLVWYLVWPRRARAHRQQGRR
jgi:hypothetical protein